MFIGKFNKSLIITYIGIVFTVIGMNFALQKDFKFAIICLVVAGVCDLFDGKVARACKRTEEEKLLGIQADSLADTVAFVAFPVIFGYALGLNEWYHIIGYILLIIAGITRLGFFNVLVTNGGSDTPVKYYSGLPVTSTSMIVPLVWLIFQYIGDSSLYNIVYTVLTYVIALLFVLNIKVPKFKGAWYPIMGVVAIIAIVLLILV